MTRIFTKNFLLKTLVIMAILFVVGFHLAGHVAADTAAGGDGDWMGIDLTIQDVSNIITGIACWLLRVGTVIAIIFVILAGIRFMYAQGNPKGFDDAKKNFVHVLIGLMVLYGFHVIIATVANAVGSSFSFVPLAC